LKALTKSLILQIDFSSPYAFQVNAYGKGKGSRIKKGPQKVFFLRRRFKKDINYRRNFSQN